MSAQFIGSKISLISKSEIRYEGILYTIDPRESTIALAKVRSFGTEDRSADKPVAPRSEVYEYIIFRASDIKDLLVDDPPAASPALADPAIIQAQSVAGSASNAFPSSAFPSGGSSSLSGSASAGQSNKQSTLSTVLGRSSPIAEKSSSRRASPGVRAKSPAGSQSGEHRSGQRQDANRAPGGYPRTGGSNATNYRNTRQGQSSRAPSNNVSNNTNNRDTRRNNLPQSDWPARQAPIGGGNRARPRPTMLDVRKLEEFDFEKANAEFVELTKDVEDLKLTEGKDEEPQDDQKKENVETYNKAKSFFDTISCEAIERQKGTMNRVDRRQERKLNQETFGVSGVYNRNWNNRGRGGPGQRNMQSRGYNQGGRGPRTNNGSGGQGGGRYPRNNFNNFSNNNYHNYRPQQHGGDRRPQAPSQGESKKTKEVSSESAGASAPTVWT